MIASKTVRPSLVYFSQPNYDTVSECILTCQGADRPARYSPIECSAFLAMIFAEQQTTE